MLNDHVTSFALINTTTIKYITTILGHLWGTSSSHQESLSRATTPNMILHPDCSRRQIASKADGSTVDLGNVPITLDELDIDLYPVSGSHTEG